MPKECSARIDQEVCKTETAPRVAQEAYKTETAQLSPSSPEEAYKTATAPRVAHKRRKTEKVQRLNVTPRDVVVCILSRVPIRFYPCVKLASRDLNTMLSSQDISEFRKRESLTEPLTLIALTHGWYSLRETLSGKHTLIPYPYPPIKPSS